MSGENEILILDSSILFDLLDLNLMEDFFQLKFEIFSTHQVIAEIRNENQLSQVIKYISSGSLTNDLEGSLEAIQTIFDKHPGLSFTDCSVLESAIRKKGMILSSDKSLCNESKRRNLNARGLLWLIEELIKNNILTIERALDRLRIYPELNQRVPRKEIVLLIAKLEMLKMNNNHKI